MTSQPLDITLRIICIDPPATQNDARLVFGLQDKDQHLIAGQTQLDGSLAFTASIHVKGTLEVQSPDFAGPLVQGKASQRFLYLSLGTQLADGWRWVRRIKVPLSGITWALIEEALKTSGVIEGTVDGTKSATVPLLGEGWIVTER